MRQPLILSRNRAQSSYPSEDEVLSVVASYGPCNTAEILRKTHREGESEKETLLKVQRFLNELRSMRNIYLDRAGWSATMAGMNRAAQWLGVR